MFLVFSNTYVIVTDPVDVMSQDLLVTGMRQKCKTAVIGDKCDSLCLSLCHKPSINLACTCDVLKCSM